MAPRASLRLSRTGLVGSIVLGLAASGHLAGRGQLPILTGLVGAGQLWLHWGLNALSTGTPPAVTEVLLAGRAGHASHGTVPAVHETFAVAGPAHAAAPDLLMFASHAVAVLATALLLARGERLAGL